MRTTSCPTSVTTCGLKEDSCCSLWARIAKVLSTDTHIETIQGRSRTLSFTYVKMYRGIVVICAVLHVKCIEQPEHFKKKCSFLDLNIRQASGWNPGMFLHIKVRNGVGPGGWVLVFCCFSRNFLNLPLLLLQLLLLLEFFLLRAFLCEILQASFTVNLTGRILWANSGCFCLNLFDQLGWWFILNAFNGCHRNGWMVVMADKDGLDSCGGTFESGRTRTHC